MKNCLLSILFLVIFFSAYSQEREKDPHYNYFSFGTSVYTNTTGTFNQKLFMTAEAGRTYGIFDIGIMLGRLNVTKSDTSWFTEVLPTINCIFQRKIF